MGEKGHFAVYSREGRRFAVPLCYLNHPLFRVLLEMAEEQFGTAVTGPIQVPCEEELMDCILSVLKKESFRGRTEHSSLQDYLQGILHISSFPSLWGFTITGNELVLQDENGE